MKLMPHAVRKAALTIHIIASVGWLGAIGAFLVMAVAGLTSPDARLVRAAYIGMNLTGWTVIFPLSLAALLSGIVQGSGTAWGLFRHYWVLIKLMITALATALLLVHLQPVGAMAEMALAVDLAPSDMNAVRVQLIADAAAAVLALLATTVLSVYKPHGLTRHGQRVSDRQQAAARSAKGS